MGLVGVAPRLPFLRHLASLLCTFAMILLSDTTTAINCRSSCKQKKKKKELAKITNLNTTHMAIL